MVWRGGEVVDYPRKPTFCLCLPRASSSRRSFISGAWRAFPTRLPVCGDRPSERQAVVSDLLQACPLPCPHSAHLCHFEDALRFQAPSPYLPNAGDGALVRDGDQQAGHRAGLLLERGVHHVPVANLGRQTSYLRLDPQQQYQVPTRAKINRVQSNVTKKLSSS